MAKKRIGKLPTNAEVEKHEMLSPMLNSVSNEMQEMSKKKQDGALNELKVKMINRILDQIKDLLSDEATSQFLDLLDNETLPTNSDAVLILAQYQAAMRQFRDKYFGLDTRKGARRWFTKENP